MEPKDIAFETPQIVDHGDLAELTAAQSDGGFTDAAFPVDTPRDQLTFSN
ncbi:MAG: lasso RiPP family leader peptide-containing protein [Actinomycetota bacterium]|nr:lasso RiPP family leader peptide-containing protein [Actinomycetota bacterium]